jgi:membrane protein required for colicin V production
MNAADYLILAVVGISMLTSLMRGLIAEVMSMAVWALALWISATTSGAFAASFLGGIEQPAVRLGTAYISIFLCVLVLGGIVTWVIRRIVAKTGLSSTDRMLGGLFGFARGLLIVFSTVLFAGFTAIPQQPIWRESVLLPTVQSAARNLSQYLPESVRSFLNYPKNTFDHAAHPDAERVPKT